ncbi:ABC transporter permease [Solimonas marina]|uniref:FtsX-like permease family protein n=1 Tax=Solimonas marina TaxID=2714601 RepID=A0A969WCL6_9GAMM|nr:FtsX-like permease family protein [Solimonas marina]NKF24074.1 FtsX-like permease family protein [Solimonas marina]
MKYFPLLWAGLWRKKARTVFTLLSIVVAFLLFGMLQGVNAAFQQGVNNANVNRLVVTSRISLTEALPISQQQQIASVPGVAGVAYAVWFGAYYQDPKNFVFATPVDIEQYLHVVPEVKVAADQVAALQRDRTGLIVGSALMQKYGWKIGQRISLHSTIWVNKYDGTSDWPFNIVGTYSFTGDDSQNQGAFFNYRYLDEARTFGTGTVGWWIVSVKDPNQSAQIANAIDTRFANSQDETKSQSEKEFAQSFLKQFGDINFIVKAILGAVFFTLLFLTGNTMMQSVRERVPELAVLKTLGFSDAKVMTLVLAESLLLCVIAAALGLLLACLIFPALKSVVGTVTLPPDVLASGAIVAVLLALATGGLPAWRAQRLAIVDALAGR